MYFKHNNSLTNFNLFDIIQMTLLVIIFVLFFFAAAIIISEIQSQSAG
jgi:hypothetical protein